MKFIFTFCQKDEARKDSYVVIEAQDAWDAREIMFGHYGKEWAFQYTSEEAAGVFKFGLTEIPLGE